MCNLRMPGMNGLLFLQAARTRFPETPVVLMSGDCDADAAMATFRSGAYDYLRKPIRIRDLIECLEKVEKCRRPGRQRGGNAGLIWT